MTKAKYFTAEEVDTFVNKLIKPLFVYGSLMIPAIVAHVIDGVSGPVDEDKIKSLITPATLHGFRRFGRKNCKFPAALDGFPGSSVRGLVLFGLTSGQRGRIDGYERGLYSRETHDVTITLESGEEHIIDADVYIWAGDRELLTESKGKVWSLDEFLETSFCKDYLSTISRGK